MRLCCECRVPQACRARTPAEGRVGAPPYCLIRRFRRRRSLPFRSKHRRADRAPHELFALLRAHAHVAHRAAVPLLRCRLEQRRRLVGRGDPPDKVEQRLAIADAEAAAAADLGMRLVVNDDLDRALAEVAALIRAARD